MLRSSGRGESRRGGEDGRRGRRRRSARLCSARLEDEGEGGGENGHGSVGDKDDARARQARFADGRRVASPATTLGRGMGARTASLESQ